MWTIFSWLAKSVIGRVVGSIFGKVVGGSSKAKQKAGGFMNSSTSTIIFIVIGVAATGFYAVKYYSAQDVIESKETRIEELVTRNAVVSRNNTNLQASLDVQNKSLDKLKERSDLLERVVRVLEEQNEEISDKYADIIKNIQNTELDDKSCEGVAKWMADQTENF